MQDCTKRNVSTETKLRFHVFQDERFVDLNLYQYGWEQTEPLHSYGPYARNHYLFHYVISGKGLLLANEQEYTIEGGHGFLIAPGQVTTYRADEQEPWEYTWIEFDGLRAHEALNLAGISGQNRSYFSKVFRDTMGESPQGFLLHYRMARAAQLLTESRLPISTMVSYPNQLHFSRAFKNVYGISPRDYRAKHLAL